MVVVLHYGRIGRDREMIEDIYALRELIPRGEVISVSEDLIQIWSLHAYFQRYVEISLHADEPVYSDYLLVKKGHRADLKESYIELPVNLNQYQLYLMRK